MSNWDELPYELLKQIFCFYEPQLMSYRGKRRDSLFSVCTKWREAALVIVSEEITFSRKNSARLGAIIENISVGYKVKKVNICLHGDPKETIDILLHIAKNCPNVTSISCTYDCKKTVWEFLSQVSKNYFKNLKRIPNPGERSDINCYTGCALMYWDRLETLYVNVNTSCAAKRDSEIDSLQKFVDIRSLHLLKCNYESVQDMDYLFDVYPQLTYLNILTDKNLNTSNRKSSVYNQKSIIPHKNINTLNAKLVYDKNMFNYLIHKFPNLKGGVLKLFNQHTAEETEQDRYLSVDLHYFVYYTPIKNIYLDFHTSYKPLLEIVKNTTRISCLTISRLNSYEDVFGRNIRVWIKGEEMFIYFMYEFSRKEILEIWNNFPTCPTTLISEDYNIKENLSSETLIVDALTLFKDLTKMKYNCLTVVNMPDTTLIETPNNSLKSLCVKSEYIEEIMYPFFSSYCQALTQMCLKLEKIRSKTYTIDMRYTHLEHFEIFSRENCRRYFFKIKTESQEKMFIVEKKNRLKEVFHVDSAVSQTIIMIFRGIDYFTFRSHSLNTVYKSVILMQ